MRKNIWSSIHIGEIASWDEALREVLIPFIQMLKNKKYIQDFFFVFYWSGSLGLKIRVQKTAKISKKKFEEIATEYFKEEKISFIPYIPEEDRYGGPKGMPLAEKNFILTSQIVITVFQSIHPSYSIRFKLALEIIARLINILAFTPKQKEDFYSFRFDHRFKNKSKDMRSFYQKRFINEDQKLYFYIAALDKIAVQYVVHDSYLSKIKQNIYDLQSLARNKKLTIYQCEYLQEYKGIIPTDILIFWHILDSYLHMICNRLGILTEDEGCLLYIMDQSFKLMNQNND